MKIHLALCNSDRWENNGEFCLQPLWLAGRSPGGLRAAPRGRGPRGSRRRGGCCAGSGDKDRSGKAPHMKEYVRATDPIAVPRSVCPEAGVAQKTGRRGEGLSRHGESQAVCWSTHTTSLLRPALALPRAVVQSSSSHLLLSRAPSLPSRPKGSLRPALGLGRVPWAVLTPPPRLPEAANPRTPIPTPTPRARAPSPPAPRSGRVTRGLSCPGDAMEGQTCSCRLPDVEFKEVSDESLGIGLYFYSLYINATKV